VRKSPCPNPSFCPLIQTFLSYDPSWRARRRIGSGKLAQGKVLNDDRADWGPAYALFTGDVAYVWHGALHGDVVAADLAACGLQRRAQIVWVKHHHALSRGHYHWRARKLLVRGARRKDRALAG
jgi:hypothetical protein